MDRVTTTEALRILQGRGLTVSYPTVARWVQNGLFEGAERVEETRGPVWMIPRASVMKFTPPKPTGRPPKTTKKGEQQAKAPNTNGRVTVKKGGEK